MRTINRIFVHTAAASSKGVPVDQSAKTIRDYHVREKGWADIGYNYVVRFDGTVESGRPEDRVPAGVEGANSDSLHLCLSGHGDLAPPTAQQWEAAVKKVAELIRKHGLEARFRKNMMVVVGHREINDLITAGVYPRAPRTTKTCPGTKVDMRAFRLAVLKELG